MPVYEYECKDCGKQFEEFQGINDKPLKSCRFCKGSVQRLISQTSFALKGGGWYQDGYHKPSPKSKTESKPKEKSSKNKEKSAKVSS